MIIKRLTQFICILAAALFICAQVSASYCNDLCNTQKNEHNMEKKSDCHESPEPNQNTSDKTHRCNLGFCSQPHANIKTTHNETIDKKLNPHPELLLSISSFYHTPNLLSDGKKIIKASNSLVGLSSLQVPLYLSLKRWLLHS